MPRTRACRFLRVVKLTLLGSIISNLLLVMGSAFVAGGLVHPLQRFNQQGINVNCGLLILAGALRMS
jgi:Ca2+:H+ antiporter